MRETAKIVTIHQPNYLPWCGFFSKIQQANCLIIGDTFQYVKNSVINRNKIRTRNGWCYLTIPLGKVPHDMKIRDVTLPENNMWQNIHWEAIYDNYVKSRFFRAYRDFFEELYKRNFEYLEELNEEVIRQVLRWLNIEIEILRASEIKVDPQLKKTELIVALLKNAGADTYLSGPSGRDYLEVETLASNGIELKFFSFQHPIYVQRYANFESNMSVIDLLFNVGPSTSEILRKAGGIEDSEA